MAKINREKITIMLMMYKIKKFLGDPYYVLGNFMMKHCPKLMSDKYFLKVRWKKWMGYELDLVSPRTLNEKLQWLKLYDHNPLFTQLADKYEMKEVVKNMALEGVETIPTLFVYDKVSDIRWEDLPERFVVKCNHDSGSAIFCADKSSFDKESAICILERAINRNYFYKEREWAYKDIKPRIMVEPYLVGDDGKPLVDYKFYIYGGELQYWMYSVGETAHTGTNLKFSPEKENIDYLFKEKPMLEESEVVLPKNIDEMISVARILGKPFKHVRIDMYSVNGVIYIGEFTFYSSGGTINIHNRNYSQKLADMIDTSK